MLKEYISRGKNYMSLESLNLKRIEMQKGKLINQFKQINKRHKIVEDKEEPIHKPPSLHLPLQTQPLFFKTNGGY
jgi:hypothetical protein